MRLTRWTITMRSRTASWMSMRKIEKIMSKTNDISKFVIAEDHHTLADSELDAVTGGRIPAQHPAKVTVPDIKVTIRL